MLSFFNTTRLADAEDEIRAIRRHPKEDQRGQEVDELEKKLV